MKLLQCDKLNYFQGYILSLLSILDSLVQGCRLLVGGFLESFFGKKLQKTPQSLFFPLPLLAFASPLVIDPGATSAAKWHLL